MSKFKITIVILIILVSFAGADFYLNRLGTKINVKNPSGTAASSAPYFKPDDVVMGYKITNQVKTSQIFGKIDLSGIENITIYSNQLKKELSSAAASSVTTKALSNQTTPALPLKKASPKIPTLSSDTAYKTIYLYEIQGPKGQGSLTYLKTKLKFISQINTATETINENASYGNNSFFFNNLNYKNTAFLLVQINDNLFAFEYSKQDVAAYDDVKAIINKLISKS